MKSWETWAHIKCDLEKKMLSCSVKLFVLIQVQTQLRGNGTLLPICSGTTSYINVMLLAQMLRKAKLCSGKCRSEHRCTRGRILDFLLHSVTFATRQMAANMHSTWGTWSSRNSSNTQYVQFEIWLLNEQLHHNSANTGWHSGTLHDVTVVTFLTSSVAL